MFFWKVLSRENGIGDRNKRFRNWAATKKKTTGLGWADFAVVRKVGR
jgi:hypothetical protein